MYGRATCPASCCLHVLGKRIFAHHPSHHDKGKEGTGLLSIFVSLLAEPLSKTGASRTDADHLTIELVLHLFRNLLSVEPLLNSKFQTVVVHFIFKLSQAHRYL